jgi:hypothetical protein
VNFCSSQGLGSVHAVRWSRRSSGNRCPRTGSVSGRLLGHPFVGFAVHFGLLRFWDRSSAAHAGLARVLRELLP